MDCLKLTQSIGWYRCLSLLAEHLLVSTIQLPQPHCNLKHEEFRGITNYGVVLCYLYLSYQSYTLLLVSLCTVGDSVEHPLPLWSSSSVEEGLKMDLCKLGIQLLLCTELLEPCCLVHGGFGDLWRGVCEGGNWAGWCFCSQTAEERQMISFPKQPALGRSSLACTKGDP